MGSSGSESRRGKLEDGFNPQNGRPDQKKCFAYQYNLLTDGRSKYFIVWNRYYSEKEIHDLLQKIGFSKIQIFKNVLDDNNFTSANEMFIVAIK